MFQLADPSVDELHDRIRHLRDCRVVRDDGGGGAQLAIDPIDHLEHEDAGLKVQRAVMVLA